MISPRFRDARRERLARACTLHFLALLAGMAIGCGSRDGFVDPARLGPKEVAVVAVHPLSQQIRLQASVGITFSRELGTPRPSAALSTAAPVARWSPEIPGSWRWATRDRLEFVPEGPYEPNAVYTLTLEPQFVEAAGLSLKGPRAFRFVADPFECLSVRADRQRAPGAAQACRLVAFFAFNYPVDPDEFERHFALELERRGPVEFDVEPGPEPGQLRVRSAIIELEEERESARLTLRQGLRCQQGDAGLGADLVHVESLPSRSRLVIERVQRVSREGSPVVRVELSHAVGVDAFREAFTVEPTPADLVVAASDRDILLKGDWKAGRSYAVRVAGTLVAVDGARMERDFEGSIHIGDLEPSVSIAGEGIYLCLRGEQTIAVQSVNVDRLDITLERVYPNNLVPLLREDQLWELECDWWWRLDRVGSRLYQRSIEVESPVRNATAVTPIPLQQELQSDSRGIFRLRAVSSRDPELAATKVVVATDLGILAKQGVGALQVAVVSIRDLMPQAGVEVEILSYNNQSLARGRTDSEGLAAFRLPVSDSRGERPFLITATRGSDLGFLQFEDCRVRTADLDVGGAPYTTSGYDAFLYGDRDIFRPGDAARLAWIVRDAARVAPPAIPLTLRIMGPDGKTFSESRVTSGEVGVGERTLEIPEWALTGRYAARLELDEKTTIGSFDFLVEDFIPERMKVEVEFLGADDRPIGEGVVIGRGESPRVKARALSFFGPPAANRHAVARVSFTHAPARFESYPGFSFGDALSLADLPAAELGERETDSLGIAEWRFPFPDVRDLHGWIRADLQVEVSELGGGRAVRTARSMLLTPVDRMIGLRQAREEGSDYREPGEPIAFDAVLVGADGEPAAADDARLRVYRERWQTLVRREPGGDLRYVSECQRVLVEERHAPLGAGLNELAVTVAEHGSYQLVVESDAAGARASLRFYAYGWGYSPWALSAPERIGIKLDKEVYLPGEEIRVEIEAPFEGLLLLTLERDQVLERQWVRLEGNSATARMRAPRDLGPNAYVVAMLLRPLQSLALHAPARAFGVAPLFLDRSGAVLPIEARVPDAVRQGSELRVGYRVTDLQEGEEAQVTIALVDEGILQITGFASPSPIDYYFRRRRLGVESFDIWSRLMPEYAQVLRASATGGDGGEMGRLHRDLNPVSARRVAPVALWSGIVRGTRDWREVSFELPEFNGTVRAMVVASAGMRFGSVERMIQVRDPIVLNANLPRFLAPGDEIQVPVQVYNGLHGADPAGTTIQVAMRLSGPVESIDPAGAVQEVRIPAGQEQVVRFGVRATDAIGKALFGFEAQAAGEKTSCSVEMAVRPPEPRDCRAATGIARAGQPGRHTFSTAWYPGTTRGVVSASFLPVAQFAAALPYLLRYPHGCVEQTTSRVFPLLYFADLARELAPEMFGERDADYYIHAGIDRVLAMQTSSGGFAFWPGGDHAGANPWVTVYVTHFLVEAREAGYAVPEAPLAEALAEVRRILVQPQGRFRGRWVEWEQLRAQTYAAYVLAFAGEPERGAMDFLLRSRLQDREPTSRVFLAGAFGLCGDRATLNAILPARPPESRVERYSGYTWRSAAGDDARQLMVLASVAPDHDHVPVLMQRLTAGLDETRGRWATTQENGFALIAVGKLIRKQMSEASTAEILLDGRVVGRIDREGTTLAGDDWPGKEVEVRVAGEGTCYFSILDEGIPRKGEARECDAGVTVRREYLDEQGRPVSLEGIEQGSLVTCRLSAQSESGPIENVVITDMVPAGLEIENPRLTEQEGHEALVGRFRPELRRNGGGPYSAAGRRDGAQGFGTRPGRHEGVDLTGHGPLPVEHLDIRDDRLLLFTRVGQEPCEFYYALRAVTVGSYTLPPVKAEAMYDPDRRSIRGGGRVVVRAR